MLSIIDRIIEVAEILGWNVDTSNKNGNIVLFTFSKKSPAGQNFCFEVKLEENNIEKFIKDIWEYSVGYDASCEAYSWIETHGYEINGVLCNKKAVFKDMESCKENIRILWRVLCNQDWRNP